ncbi:hypothetical protein [Ferruginivarius sediminum]|uniref:hypothetical protein n=1 Tax=Ferruginivarius sediminum TaxID=2661937 RepID=UPI0011C036EF|nr:hypothetical protein [Ferruginivarius sediminum]
MGLTLSGGKGGLLFRFSGLSNGAAGNANYSRAIQYICQDIAELIEKARFGGSGKQLGLCYSSQQAASLAPRCPVEASATAITSSSERKRLWRLRLIRNHRV